MQYFVKYAEQREEKASGKNMSFNIKNNIIKRNEENIKELSTKALDELWKKSWIKDNLLNPNSHISQIEKKLGEMEGKYQRIVVIAPREVKLLLEAVTSTAEACKTKLIIFADSFSSDYYYDKFLELRDKDWGMLVIGCDEETLGQKTAYSCMKQFLSDKYGSENLKRRIQFIINSKSEFFSEEAAKGEYKTYILPSDVDASYSCGTDMLLVPMLAAGFDVKGFYTGFREMISSPEWDRNEDEYANYIGVEGSQIIAIWQKKLELLSKWIVNIFSSQGVPTKEFFLPEDECQILKGKVLIQIALTECEHDIMLPFFPGVSMEGSMNAMIKEHISKWFDEYRGSLIEMDKLDPYLLGKLVGYIQISSGISRYITEYMGK